MVIDVTSSSRLDKLYPAVYRAHADDFRVQVQVFLRQLAENCIDVSFAACQMTRRILLTLRPLR